MKTELIISLNVEDVKKIIKDLINFVEKTDNLNPETYLLYNKIKSFNVPYSEIEK